MKYILVPIISTVMIACEADGDEGLPSFANSLPLYVQLDNPSSISAEEGEEVAITIELPKAVFGDVNVDWELTGDIAASGTVTIAEGDLSADVLVAIPDDNVVTGGGAATFSLTSVDNGLSLGRPNADSSITATALDWSDND